MRSPAFICLRCLADGFEVGAHLLERVLDQHARIEAAHGLLDAAIGVTGQVGQRVEHHAGQAGREGDFQPRLLGVNVAGRSSWSARFAVLRDAIRAALGDGLVDAVDQHREGQAHAVALFVGERLDGDLRQAGLLDAAPASRSGARRWLPRAFGHQAQVAVNVRRPPANSLALTVLGRRDACPTFTVEEVSGQKQFRPHLLVLLEVVVNVGRQHDFVPLDEEARRLQADQQVLGGGDLVGGVADLGGFRQRIAVQAPGGQRLREADFGFGFAVGVEGERGQPEGGVGEVHAHFRFEQGRGAGAGVLGLEGASPCRPGRRPTLLRSKPALSSCGDMGDADASAPTPPNAVMNRLAP